jgi:hypothetical protein
MTRSLRVLPLLPLLFGCASVATRPPGAPEVHLVDGHGGPEVDALSDAFVTQALTPEAFGKDLAAALAQHPDSGELQLLAGYWAVLQADDDTAWEHFLRAAADRNNPQASLAARELAALPLTAGPEATALDALAELAAAHPDPEVRALAAHTRARLLLGRGAPDQARQAAEPLGMVRAFQLIGAFDNEEGKGFATPYPPEAAVDLEAEVQGKLVPVRWRPLPGTEPDGAAPLGDFVSPGQQAVAYLVTWVHADAAGPVQLRFSTSAPVAAWLNDAAVVADPHVRAFAVDDVVGEGALHAGWNKLLIKSAQKRGAWRVGVRLTDAQGASLPGLSYSIEAQATPHGEAAPVVTPPASGARAGFFAARALALTGHPAAAGQRFSALQAAHPQATLLRFFTAQAAEADERVEHALSLLTGGIRADPRAPAALRLQRADIYERKGLKDQAQRDLEAVIAAQPHARAAQVQLARLLGSRGWQHDRELRLREAAARWPDSREVLYELADVRDDQGYPAEAEALWRRGLELGAGQPAPLRRLRDAALRRQEFAAAEGFAAQLAALQPFALEDQLARAELSRRAGHPEEAEARLAQLTAQDPDLAGVYVRRAHLAEERGDGPRTVALLEQAQERDPNDAWVTERLDHLHPPQADALTPYQLTDEALDQLLAHLPEPTQDPAAQVQLLLDDTVTQVNADGSTKAVVTSVERALNQQGRDGVMHIALPGKSKNRVLKAFAISPDGERTEASSVTNGDVRFRSLEVGSVVVLQYVSYGPRGESAAEGQFFTANDFGAINWHIDHSRWVVLTEHGRPVSVDAPREVHVETTQAGGWDVRTFTRDGAPAVPGEPNMAPYADLLSRVRITTFPSWDNFVSWEKALLLESFPLDPKVDALAAKLTEGAATPREKLDRLYTFVSREIRYQIEYESIIAGWQPHPSATVLERKYGDCKDKATLLIALARSVGLQLDFAVLGTRSMGHLGHAIPYPDFNHAIVHVPEQPGIAEAFFMDPTADALDLGNVPGSDQGSQSLVLDPRTGAWRFVEIPYQAPRFQSDVHQVELAIAAGDKARATERFSLRGDGAASLRIGLRNEKRAQQAYGYLANVFFPRSTLLRGEAPDHEDFSHPVTVNLDMDVSATIQKEGQHFRIKMPPFFTAAEQVSLPKRETPLDLRTRSASSVELHASLPEGMQFIDPPQPVELSSPCLKVKRSVQAVGRELRVHDEYEHTCPQVSAADYPAFREAVQKANAALDQAIVFGPAAPKAVRAPKR